jgi:hypothetical protein
VPKFNLIKGEENPHIVLTNGEIVYYEETTEKNYTAISTPIKKANRHKVTDAVKSKLLYFENVSFKYTYENGGTTDIGFKANKMYESENIIVSDNRIYSKPQILIVKDAKRKKHTDGVCYGYINFAEMDMPELYGGVAIKCSIRSVIDEEIDGKRTGKQIVIQDGVSVTPSREKVIWDENTRDYLKAKFEAAVDEAAGMVSNQLLEKDFLQWLRKCSEVLNGVDRYSVLGRLTSIIDKSQIKPKYSKDHSIRYDMPSEIFWGMKVRRISKVRDNKNGGYKIQRDMLQYWSGFDPDKLYIQEEATAPLKDHFLIDTGGGAFLTLQLMSDEEIDTTYLASLSKKGLSEKQIETRLERRKLILKYINESRNLKNYDDISVDEKWKKRFEENEKKTVDSKGTVVKLTPKELRALQQKTVCYTLQYDYTSDYHWNDKTTLFQYKKREPKIADIKDFEGDLYYGYQVDGEKLHLAAAFSKQIVGNILGYKDDQHIDDVDFNLFRISKGNKKHFKDHKHVDEFFERVENKIITMDSRLVKWQTAHRIHQHMEDLRFLANYRLFDAELRDIYWELKEYVHENYTNLSDWRAKNKFGMEQKSFEKLEARWEQLINFQLYVEENSDDTEAVAKKAKEMMLGDVSDAKIIDLDIYAKLRRLVDYAAPIKHLFMHIELLCDEDEPTIPRETELLIKEFLDCKGIL